MGELMKAKITKAGPVPNPAYYAEREANYSKPMNRRTMCYQPREIEGKVGDVLEGVAAERLVAAGKGAFIADQEPAANTPPVVPAQPAPAKPEQAAPQSAKGVVNDG